MRAGFAGGLDPIVAVGASVGDGAVVKYGGCPGVDTMASVTAFGCGNVIGGLADSCLAVVAARAST